MTSHIIQELLDLDPYTGLYLALESGHRAPCNTPDNDKNLHQEHQQVQEDNEIPNSSANSSSSIGMKSSIGSLQAAVTGRPKYGLNGEDDSAAGGSLRSASELATPFSSDSPSATSSAPKTPISPAAPTTFNHNIANNRQQQPYHSGGSTPANFPSWKSVSAAASAGKHKQQTSTSSPTSENETKSYTEDKENLNHNLPSDLSNSKHSSSLDGDDDGDKKDKQQN